MAKQHEYKFSPLQKLASEAAIIALGVGACSSGANTTGNESNAKETTVAVETFTGTPKPAPESEASTSSAIDTEAGDEIPERVMELMQMPPEEFYQLTPEEQAIYHTWQLAHPFHVDTSNFQTTVLDGWNPHFVNLDEAYNPLTNPADRNDSDEDIANQLRFMMDAVWAQFRLDEDEGLDHVDRDAAEKMMGLYYAQDFSQLGEKGSSGQLVVLAIKDKLNLLEQMGNKVRPQQIEPTNFGLVPGTGEEQTVTGPDGVEKRTRSFLGTERDSDGAVLSTVEVTVAIAELPTYNGGKTAVWKIVEINDAR